MLVHLPQHHCSRQLCFTIYFSLRNEKKRDSTHTRNQGMMCWVWAALIHTKPGSWNHGQPIWALNERNGWPVPAPLKTHLHPVRFHYAAGWWEWTESGRNSGLCSTRPCKLTATLHQTFLFPSGSFLFHSFIISSFCYFLLLLLLTFPWLPVGDNQEWNPIFKLLYIYIALRASVQD